MQGSGPNLIDSILRVAVVTVFAKDDFCAADGKTVGVTQFKGPFQWFSTFAYYKSQSNHDLKHRMRF